MELLTGSGLAISAGLNAYVPLLLVGLLGRFTELVSLPSAWAWLSGDVALIVLGVLLLVEVVADKVPSVDHVNDLLQTVVRPTSGGIVFAAGGAPVDDAGQILSAGTVLPVVAGVLLALLTHLAKAGLRAGVNLSTAGVGAPVASSVEDVFSVSLSLLALLLPLLVLVAVVGAVATLVGVRRRRRRRDRLRT